MTSVCPQCDRADWLTRSADGSMIFCDNCEWVGEDDELVPEDK